MGRVANLRRLPQAAGEYRRSLMALVGLLAYKAIQHLSPGQSNAGTTGPGVPANAGASSSGLGGLLSGGLGSLLQGSLGGLLAGGAAGSVLSGGLNDLLKQFQQSGQSDVAQSWVNNRAQQTDISRQICQRRLGQIRSKRLWRKVDCHAMNCSRASVSSCLILSTS